MSAAPVRKRPARPSDASRSPVKVVRVLKTAAPGSLLAKLRELEAKLADDDTAEMEHQVAQELAAHLYKLEHPEPAAKAARHQPAARVTRVSPAVTANQAHALAGALGLRRTAEQSEKAAREMTDRAKAAAKSETSGTGHEGRVVDVPAAAKPQVLHRPLPSVQEYTSTGQRLPGPTRDAVVYTAVTEAYVRANRQPVTLSPAELGRGTGLSAELVNQAIVSLERRGLIQRQPGRSGTVALWSPAQI